MTRVSGCSVGWPWRAPLAQAAAPPQPAGGSGRSAHRDRRATCRAPSVDDLRASPITGHLRVHPRHRHRLRHRRRQVRHQRRPVRHRRRTTTSPKCHRRELRNKLMAAVPRGPDAGVRAEGSEVHHHGVHRRRLRLTAASSTARSPTTTSSGSACATCSIRAPAPTPSSWTKAEQVWCSPDRNDALTQGQARPGPEDQGLRRQPGGALLRAGPASSPCRAPRRSCSPTASMLSGLRAAGRDAEGPAGRLKGTTAQR